MKIIKKGQAFDHVEVMLDTYYHFNPLYDKVTFLLGYNLYSENELADVIKREHVSGHKVIAYQLEQLYKGSRWVTKHGISCLRQMDEVWDYDLLNIEFLSSTFNITPKLRPMLYTEDLNLITKVPVEKHDIDLLFYGSMNEARANTLTNIRKANPGKNVVFLDNAWGVELDNNIARSKIVLNLHYYPTIRQEQVRMFYLLINGKCVVSEYSVDNYLGDCIYNINRDSLGYVCNELLNTGAWLKQTQRVERAYKELSDSYIKRFR